MKLKLVLEIINTGSDDSSFFSGGFSHREKKI